MMIVKQRGSSTSFVIHQFWWWRSRHRREIWFSRFQISLHTDAIVRRPIQNHRRTHQPRIQSVITRGALDRRIHMVIMWLTGETSQNQYSGRHRTRFRIFGSGWTNGPDRWWTSWFYESTVVSETNDIPRKLLHGPTLPHPDIAQYPFIKVKSWVCSCLRSASSWKRWNENNLSKQDSMFSKD